MLPQLLLALALTSATVAIHALGTIRIVLPIVLNRHGEFPAVSALRRPVLTLIRLVSGLLALHLIEIALWAGVYTLAEIFPTFETSLYYSLKSYTTVGYGDVLPPNNWRLMGPIEAAVGVLMLGLSTSVIITAVHRIHETVEREVDSKGSRT